MVSFAIVAQHISAQWGYTTPEQANRAAYEAGQAWARNMQAQNDAAYTSGQVWGATLAGKQALVNHEYLTAIQKFMEAAKLSNGAASCAEALMYLGACCELGMGIEQDKSLALELYQSSSNLGYYPSKEALRRINSTGYWPANNTTRQNFCAIVASTMNMPYSGGNSLSSPSSSSYSDGGIICKACSGTGKCTMCNGDGYYWLNDTGMYVGENRRTKVQCDPKCKVCYGKGRI